MARRAWLLVANAFPLPVTLAAAYWTKTLTLGVILQNNLKAIHLVRVFEITQM